MDTTQCEYRAWELPGGRIETCPGRVEVTLSFRFDPAGRSMLRHFCSDHAEAWLQGIGRGTLYELAATPHTQQLPLFGR